MSTKRNLKKVYSPNAYRSNSFNRYSPRARITRMFLIVGFFVVLLLIGLFIWVVPKISLEKRQAQDIEVLPIPEPTSDPYKGLFMPDDIEFVEDVPSWVKTNYYGNPVKLLREPSQNAEVIMEMVDKENVIVKGNTKDYSLVLYNKTYGFIEKELIFQGKIPRTPEVINEINIEDLLSGVKKKSYLVNVQTFIPGIKVDLELAKNDNYLGLKYYPVHICLLQRDTALKLKKAQALFAKDGYNIVVWDAYRPYSTSVDIYNDVGHLSSLIPEPSKSSKNNRGAAVDITIIKNDGTPVKMPTESMTLDVETAARVQQGLDDEVKENLDYIKSVMGQAGFDFSPSEWWHFNDESWAYYPVMDYDLFDF